MLLELHTHTTRHSKCSGIEPADLVKLVAAKGIQGLVITEHHYLWSDSELAQLRLEAEVPRHFHLFAAQEVTTDIGHVLVYGAAATIPDFVRLAELRSLFPAAALVWAHPYRKGKIPSQNDLLNPLLDGVEVFSLNHTMRENYTGLRDWHRYKFTAVSGSDTHAAAQAGMFPTLFDHDIATVQGLAEEIKGRRCRPFIKEIPKAGADLVVTEITIGTKGEDEQRHRIIVKQITENNTWQRMKQTARLTESLYADGFSSGRFRVPGLIEVNDEEKLLIEEGQRGKSLFDLLATVAQKTGAGYIALAGQWLAHLHSRPAGAADAEALLKKEEHRFGSYERAFTSTGNPHTALARRMIEAVRAFERAAIAGRSDDFVQCHGDYHPKNIIIGQDRMQDPDTQFISVIDFNNAIRFLPAFDVGYFLAQFASQFSGRPDITGQYAEDLFLSAYLAHARNKGPSFAKQVSLFKLRGNLSIAAYLIRVGKGESREMDSLAERSAALLKDSA